MVELSPPRRLLSVGHSYAVGLNRRLAHEMAVAGAGRWEVVAAAPEFVHGDLRPIRFEEIAGEACRVEQVPAHFTRFPHLMLYGRRFHELMAERWDLVHCWEEPYVVAGFQTCWSPARKIPVVFWTAQNLNKSYPPPFSWFERYCVDRCAGWMACGRTVAETLLQRGYGRRPHRVMPLGVDTAVFRPNPLAGAAVRAKFGWESSGPAVVGYLGRFVEEKGVRNLMSLLGNMETPWRALFVGGGPLEGELRRWSARFPDRVRVVTGVPHGSVPDHLNAMDVLAAPSRTMPNWREQLGRMILEAFACGVPVVGSDSGEIPYVIGDSGRVVGETDEPGWTAALGELLENPVLRAEFSARGRERAERLFAWPVIARRHLDFFDEL